MERGDEGFGRNLRKIFGPGSDYAGMDRTLKAVMLSEDREEVVFDFQDGSRVVFGVEGDCCSCSWIEHLTLPEDLDGATIVSVEDARIESAERGEDGLDYLQVYNTRFRTDRGDIVLEYRNESNGYYGGYLVRRAEATP